VRTLGDQLDLENLENKVTLPDLWQQEAVAALRDGRDVVIHAPTGAGKTLVFEMWSNQGRPKKSAIYTVPTRALANDKMAEWQARGWNVGIATGDLSMNLDARILVATLETQKNRLLTGFGPGLLVIDEYQMIGDQDRGLNYELSLALCPANTQLLLMSGSVANPDEVVAWLRRLGRQAVLIRHDTRPVPLEEAHPAHFMRDLPSSIDGQWPRMIASALADDLGPVLIFAPQRKNAERLARELARQLPTPFPLKLSPEQRALVDDSLASLLENRIAYHHSGLSYGARAGVIEPLAKHGQLRVVVATMGLAAGINFSLRSVALAGNSYKRDYNEHLLEPSELLQMFGRAGRRGIDHTGYVIVTPSRFRLRDAHAGYLQRSGIVDWGALLGIMNGAARTGSNPFHQAVRVQSRLFTTKPIPLGVEFCLQYPDAPCGLKTDAERARLSQKCHREMLNSKGVWELLPAESMAPARDVVYLKKLSRESANLLRSRDDGLQKLFHTGERQRATAMIQKHGSEAEVPLEWSPALGSPHILQSATVGPWIEVRDDSGHRILTRKTKIADQLHTGSFVMIKSIRRLVGAPAREVPPDVWYQQIIPKIEERMEVVEKTPVVRIQQEGYRVYALVSLENTPLKCHVDTAGVAIWNPLTREVTAKECSGCPLFEKCVNLDKAPGVALMWKKLGLIDDDGQPTLRGQIVSFFPQGSGLAIAAAIDDADYPLQDLVFDMANLDAGFRFSSDDGYRWGGKLAITCRKTYGNTTVQGYLEGGMPPNYGDGASQIVRSIHAGESTSAHWTGPSLGIGDVDRMIIEWRSTLRQVASAPDLPLQRWKDFRMTAHEFFHEVESPTLTEIPPLDYLQTQRISHQLIFR
jgi:superfamily II DNA/RNA helicase